METPDIYDWIAVGLSVMSFALAVTYLIRVVPAYRRFRDERAAVSLTKAVGLAVISLGLVISATGLVLETMDFAVAGLSMSRGALLVLLATLVLANVRPGDHHKEHQP